MWDSLLGSSKHQTELHRVESFLFVSSMDSNQSEMQESSIDIDKLSYEIFSILETKFLFGYDDQKLWIPKQIAPAAESKPETQPQAQPQPMMVDNGV